MPAYVYSCDECSDTVEKLESRITGPPPATACEKCETGQVTRQLGVPMLHLKGGCWARDGYSSVSQK